MPFFVFYTPHELDYLSLFTLVTPMAGLLFNKPLITRVIFENRGIGLELLNEYVKITAPVEAFLIWKL